MLMKPKTRPRTFKKINKCCFRQATKVQATNAKVPHVVESARHLPSQMLPGANADHTQPLRHVFCIHQRMRHCAGSCILTVKKPQRLRGRGEGEVGGGAPCVCVFFFSNNSTFLWPHRDLPERKRNPPSFTSSVSLSQE